MSIVKGASVGMVLIGACMLFINGALRDFRSSRRNSVQSINITDSHSNTTSTSTSTTLLLSPEDDDRNTNDTLIINNIYKPLNTTTLLESITNITILENNDDTTNLNHTIDTTVNITNRNFGKKKRESKNRHKKKNRIKRGLKLKN